MGLVEMLLSLPWPPDRADETARSSECRPIFAGAMVQEVPAGGTAKIKVKARLNLHGLVSLESATQVIEEDVEEAQAADAAPAKEKDGDTPMRVK